MIRQLAIVIVLCVFSVADTGLQAKADSPYTPKPYVELKHPDWAKDAVLYQLNTRQFTEEGTFKAAAEHLPRLKDLGIGIIWLMPIHEIGVKNRKGSLGSPYSVKDYYSVNPEFGTLEDLKAFVARAHALGMHVILDWVANHTAWDNPLVEDHPDWYVTDWKGAFRPTPWWDWSDIIDLDYSKPALRKYMTDALKYWVREVGIDGYRCDVAWYVPTDFWENARRELDAIKPVFMLGEAEIRDLHARAFDATYAWSWNNAVHGITQGRANVYALFGYYSGNESVYPHDAYRLTYTANHDQNAWDGTQFERFGDGLEAAIVLSFTGEGLPMIYNGQEAGNGKRLAFFEKDPIAWRDHPLGELFRKLIALKHANPALWNGAAGGRMVPVVNTAPGQVLSFVREKDGNKLFIAVNFSSEAQAVNLTDSPFAGDYHNYFTDAETRLTENAPLSLAPWGYAVLVGKP